MRGASLGPTEVVGTPKLAHKHIWHHAYMAPCIYSAMCMWHHAYTVPHVWCHIYGTMCIRRHVYSTIHIWCHIYGTMHIQHHAYTAPCVYGATYTAPCVYGTTYMVPCVYSAMRIWHHIYGTMRIWCHAYMVRAYTALGERRGANEPPGESKDKKRNKINDCLYVPMWQKNLVAAGRTNMWQCKIPFTFQLIFYHF